MHNCINICAYKIRKSFKSANRSLKKLLQSYCFWVNSVKEEFPPRSAARSIGNHGMAKGKDHRGEKQNGHFQMELLPRERR